MGNKQLYNYAWGAMEMSLKTVGTERYVRVSGEGEGGWVGGGGGRSIY